MNYPKWDYCVKGQTSQQRPASILYGRLVRIRRKGWTGPVVFFLKKTNKQKTKTLGR